MIMIIMIIIMMITGNTFTPPGPRAATQFVFSARPPGGADAGEQQHVVSYVIT